MSKPVRRKPLSQKQRAWADYYVGKAHFNATEAARLAGYKLPRISGCENLHNPVVMELVEQLKAERLMPRDEVLQRLAEQARAEYSTYLRADGTVDLQRLLDDGKGHLVKGVKWDRNGNRAVEFYDAHAALVDVGKHLGLFAERMEHSGPNGGPITVKHEHPDLGKLSNEELDALAGIAQRLAGNPDGEGAPSPA
jgi:phage terminase small subunit